MSTSLLTPKNEGSPAFTQVKKKILKEEKTNPCTHCVCINIVSSVLGVLKQRAIVSCHSLPRSMKIVGHHVNEVQVPICIARYTTVNVARSQIISG